MPLNNLKTPQKQRRSQSSLKNPMDPLFSLLISKWRHPQSSALILFATKSKNTSEQLTDYSPSEGKDWMILSKIIEVFMQTVVDIFRIILMLNWGQLNWTEYIRHYFLVFVPWTFPSGFNLPLPFLRGRGGCRLSVYIFITFFLELTSNELRSMAVSQFISWGNDCIYLLIWNLFQLKSFLHQFQDNFMSPCVCIDGILFHIRNRKWK